MVAMCCLHIFGLPSELPFQSSFYVLVSNCWGILWAYSLGLFVLAVGAKAIDSNPRARLPVN